MATSYNDTDVTFLFKETYTDISRNHYNGDSVLLSQVRKSYKLQGIKDHVSVPLGMARGVGGYVGGYLPEGGQESGDQVEITAHAMLGRAVVTRRAMKAAQTDKGAFVRMTKRPVEQCVLSYDNFINLMLHGDGTGRLGATHTTGYVSGGATAPVLQISTASWIARWWEENELVNIGNSGDTGTEDGLFKVTAVDEANKRITLSRLSGAYDLSSGTNADSRYIYIQRTFKDVCKGLQAATVGFTSGDFLGITYSRRWSALCEDASDAPISIPMINDLVSRQIARVGQGQGPNLILTSPEVFTQLLDLQESDKRFTLSPRDKSLQGIAKFSFNGLAYDVPGENRTIGIFSDRHCHTDRLYLLNTDYIEIHHMPDQGWFDEDGRVFSRVPDKDEYEARYGGYLEAVIHPTYQACKYNLGV